ncbi:MAG TPA: serine/threonine-protein kinase, partial [Polyangiaceae bacterium]|nr:serine/threonine-protein kinase [Polyangiaceae bacterium]
MTTPSPRRFPRLVETIGEDSPLESGLPASASVAEVVAEPNPYLAGEVVGDRYRLVREIGRGGMGVVWVAHSLVLGVDVALKLIRASAASSALSSRMAREAHAAARLGHPALVRVFDFGWTRHGDPYLVMELVLGETLAALVKREARMPAIRAVQTLLPIVDGLRMAHDKGIVHRDIKPDNVFLATDALGRRQPKLLDFGIAKVDKQIDGRLTQVGAVLGSPDYMSPEQALGLDDIDERTDIWSLCV